LQAILQPPGPVRISIASDIVHEMFNQSIKIKISLEIIDGRCDTTSTSFARKPDPLATRILSY
jgi:hypothetical protein